MNIDVYESLESNKIFAVKSGTSTSILPENVKKQATRRITLSPGKKRIGFSADEIIDAINNNGFIESGISVSFDEKILK